MKRFSQCLADLADLNQIKSKNAGGDFLLNKIVGMHFGLKSLCLKRTKITDVGISKIGEGCPQLQELNLIFCSQVTDVGITKIGEGCPQLQTLNLDNCYQVTDVGISNITDACQIHKS